MAEREKHDKYCWECHEGETKLNCSACPRSYHFECLENEQKNSDRKVWQCPVCVTLNSYVINGNDERLDMLPIMVDWAFDNQEFKVLKYRLNNPTNLSIVNLIDLSKIKRLSKDKNHYTSFFELISDVRWIVHNALILFPEDHVTVKTAEALLEYFEKEIKIVKMCADCYSIENDHPNSGFTKVCKKPHLVLWAQLKGYEYWPAKFMTVDGETVSLRFFGDNTHANLKASNCFLYSKSSPEVSNKPRSKLLEKAVKEAEKYIENIRKRYGSYQLAQVKTAFDPKMWHQQLLDSVPGYGKSQKPSKVSTNRNSDALSDAVTKDRTADKAQTSRDKPKKSEKRTVGDDSEQWSESECEPLMKKSRFSSDIAPSKRKSDVKRAKDALDETFVKKSIIHIGQRNEDNAENVSEQWSLLKCREAVVQSNKAFEYVCDQNVKLQNEIKHLEQITKDLEQSNQELIEKECALKNLMDGLKEKIHQLEAANKEKTLELDKMVAKHYRMTVRKDEDKSNAKLVAKEDDDKSITTDEADNQSKEDEARRSDMNKEENIAEDQDASTPSTKKFDRRSLK